ncbi:MAG: phytoene/squalene synthase family protein [Acidimicrobiaceae bacterium]|nr:phytoene/squalene synthase family protein [Acidimicrobiaceae bacterium]
MASLSDSYKACKALNKRFGKSYYYSTFLLEAPMRPHVHALYGFCRYADDIVDDLGPVSIEHRQTTLDAFTERFYADLERGDSDDLVLRAVVDTVRKFDIPKVYFDRFLRSMRMDFDTNHYGNYDELMSYMDGSAAVIGEMVLPILRPNSEQAIDHARVLGLAFQMTNFLRDIPEDLERGRTYIPDDDIDGFGARSAFETRTATDEFKELMKFEIARTAELYTRSIAGDRYLSGSSLRCIRAARIIYSGILDRIRLLDYDVFASRAQVPVLQKLKILAEVGLHRGH